MCGAVPALPQYVFMTWCSVKKAQWQFYLLPYNNFVHNMQCSCHYDLQLLCETLFDTVNIKRDNRKIDLRFHGAEYSSGEVFWHRVVLGYDTNVLEGRAASSLRVK
jgi:hypothetical protein